VFILQIDGSKEWNVFTDTLKYPLKTEKSSQLQPPDESPDLNCILEPGDVLYIPRGHWHYALALDRPSLHLTLGIHGKTGIDWLSWVVEELRNKELWRQNIPLLSPESPSSCSQHLEMLTQELTKYLSTEEFSDRYIRHLQTAYKPIGSIFLPQQAGFDIYLQGVNTRFTQVIDRPIEIEQLETRVGYKVTVGHQEVILRGVSKSFIEKLFNTDAFTGEDVMNWLPDYDWEIDIVPLLTRLVKESILFVDRQL
jgi:hypothetical protein